MSLLQPELSSLSVARPSTATKIAGPALFAGAALLLVGAGLALGSQHAPPPGDCGLPAGVRLSDLDHHDARLVTRQLLACGDLEAGRITAERYLTTVTALDAEWARPQPIALPAVVWASSVRGFSSQYSQGSWSAAQVLGPPDVYPAYGDNAKAWASLGADDRDEWIEVGFDRPGAISGVEVYETFNPAVDRIELVTTTGRTIEAQASSAVAPGQGSMRRTASVGCTTEPIVAVRVHVSSVAVAGWNELDAIGVVPCTR
jgi:hypothetical protein